MNTQTADDVGMQPEDLDTWREAAGLTQHGWRKQVIRILGVDEKRWDRMRAGETRIPRYLALAMAAHVAGLQPWPANYAAQPQATTPPAPAGLTAGRVYQRRGGKMVAVAAIELIDEG